MHIIIAGGTGLIGRTLIDTLLQQNHQVLLLSRTPRKIHEHRSSLRVECWDANASDSLTELLEESDAVINLAGEPIAGKRWTPIQKARIRSSRIESTQALVAAIKQARHKPSVLLNASAVGFYGNVREGDVMEPHQKGDGFLADVCASWEAEALKAQESGVRVVLLRTGIVLDKRSGALQKILLPFQCFCGGPLGSGKQWFPWIHLLDEIGAILFAMGNERLSGPLNLAAPGHVRMSEFCKTLGMILRRPSWIHTPAWALKLVLGEMAAPLLLHGQKVIPQKLIAGGFTFQFPKLEDALKELLA